MKVKEMLDIEICNIIKEINLKTKFINNLRIHDIDVFKDEYNIMVTKCFCHFTYKDKSYTVTESYNYFSQEHYIVKNILNDIILKCCENEFDKVKMTVFDKDNWVDKYYNDYYNMYTTIDGYWFYKQFIQFKDKEYIFLYEIREDFNNYYKQEIIYNYIKSLTKEFIENKCVEFENNKLLNKVVNKNNITKRNKI